MVFMVLSLPLSWLSWLLLLLLLLLVVVVVVWWWSGWWWCFLNIFFEKLKCFLFFRGSYGHELVGLLGICLDIYIYICFWGLVSRKSALCQPKDFVVFVHETNVWSFRQARKGFNHSQQTWGWWYIDCQTNYITLHYTTLHYTNYNTPQLQLQL